MKHTINFTTEQGFTAIPSVQANSFEQALQQALLLAARNVSVYTFTVIGDGITRSFSHTGRLLHLTAKFA
jgi:hypothetical protein